MTCAKVMNTGFSLVIGSIQSFPAVFNSFSFLVDVFAIYLLSIYYLFFWSIFVHVFVDLFHGLV